MLDAALAAMDSCGIDLAQVRSKVSLTRHGTRMAARLHLPRNFSADPGDGHPIDLTFECFNSVDKSVPLFATLGWHRLVCSNGLVVGTTAVKLRQKHTPPLELTELADVLAEGLADATADARSLEAWRSRPVAPGALIPWIDGAVTATWGALAAGRVYHIVRTGYDSEPEQRFERVKPHDRRFHRTSAVPGAPERSETLFDVAQALSFVASHRRDFQERLGWRAQVPALMNDLNAAK